MQEDHGANRRTHGAAALFALIAVLIAGDLVTDRGEGASLLHLAVESLVLIAAAAGAAILWRRVGKARLDLAAAQAEADRWRAENRALVRGLGDAILQQFERWHLTAAECEIGLFLLTAGTILGGVWAADSWGRFWGWDPKETWALISIVIYFAVFGAGVAYILRLMHKTPDPVETTPETGPGPTRAAGITPQQQILTDKGHVAPQAE